MTDASATPAIAGPRELCERWSMERRYPHSELDLPPPLLHVLVETVFAASSYADETRFPRYNVFVPSGSGSGNRETVHFGDEVVRLVGVERPIEAPPLDVEQLRRLGPAMPPRPFALVVRGRELAGHTGLQLVATGIRRCEHSGAEFMPELAFVVTRYSPGLYICVDGPCDLTLVEVDGGTPHYALRLRHGRIERTFDATGVEIARRLAHGFVEEVASRWPGIHGDLKVREVVRKFAHAHLGKIFHAALELRHGGGFAFLPGDLSLDDVPFLNVRHREPWIPNDLRFMAPQLIMTPPRPGDVERMRDLHHRARQIEDHARAIAHASAVDGYVVLNHRFGMLGFSAEIRGEGELPECFVLDPGAVGMHGLEPTDERYDLVGRGMRHRAAARLCSRVPGSFVFVISQDGDIRAFAGLEDGRVVTCGPLRLLPASSSVNV